MVTVICIASTIKDSFKVPNLINDEYSGDLNTKLVQY